MEANRMTNEKFLTVRQFRAKEPDGLSEYAIRQLLKQKKLPVIYRGNRALLPYSACMEALNRLAVESQSS